MRYKSASIQFACRTFSISETCYRYQPKLSDENELIADRLGTLTKAKKVWGFGLCYLHLRNAKGFGWNHKRVYRIYRELELNMRIKPRKRLQREKPEPLTVPEAPNEIWSMGFMADQLVGGRSFRLGKYPDQHHGPSHFIAATLHTLGLRGISRRITSFDMLIRGYRNLSRNTFLPYFRDLSTQNSLDVVIK